MVSFLGEDDREYKSAGEMNENEETRCSVDKISAKDTIRTLYISASSFEYKFVSMYRAQHASKSYIIRDYFLCGHLPFSLTHRVTLLLAITNELVESLAPTARIRHSSCSECNAYNARSYSH